MRNDYEKTVYRNPKATLSSKTTRLKEIESDGVRTEFQRDIHRIIYSQAFRRLKHKTQVFFIPNNDHICTRMEHVLYVSAAARTVARHLGLNEDLAEAIGLGHDLGHAPFGHHGETVLNRFSKKSGLGFFQHELHGLRVVDKLAERDREEEVGLNLTYHVRDGIISHCGESFKQHLKPRKEKTKLDLEKVKNKTEISAPCSLEGCIVRMIDVIAYAGRDAEDAIVSGLIHSEDVPPLVRRELGGNNGRIIGKLIKNLIDHSSVTKDSIGLDDKHFKLLMQLKDFNYKHIYKHKRVEEYKLQASLAIEILFKTLVKTAKKTKRFTKLSDTQENLIVIKTAKKYIDTISYDPDERIERIIIDFIAGMTDNFVLNCVGELCLPKNIV